jgi:glycosyltransferase involved in cell wall biosynthesis
MIGDGPKRIKLIELAGKIGVNKNIKFLGSLENHENIFALVKPSKVLVLPTTREGFRIVIIEAMACGTPVITIKNENNAARNLIKNGKNGFICNLNENEIAEILLK